MSFLFFFYFFTWLLRCWKKKFHPGPEGEIARPFRWCAARKMKAACWENMIAHQRIQGALGPGPPCPQDLSKVMRFSNNVKRFFGSGPPWGQNSAGPPDQNPESATVQAFITIQFNQKINLKPKQKTDTQWLTRKREVTASAANARRVRYQLQPLIFCLCVVYFLKPYYA